MKKLLTIFVFCAVSLSPLYADLKISYVSGSAAVSHHNQWVEANSKTALSVNDKIKTLSNSRVAVVLDKLTRIWISPNSEVEVSSLGNESFFNLLAGKIRARVKLMSGKKFKVKTPTAVASIRGTEFVISSEGQLAVLEGKVEFAGLNPAQAMEVGAGQIGSFDSAGLPQSPREMSQEEKTKISEEWQGFDKEENKNGTNGQQGENKGKKEDLKGQIADLRKEIHDIVGNIKTDINTAREITNEIKEADLSSGRTLRDVHGNLVRVEQHLIRPDSRTLEILNLTKRSEYRYSDRQRWGFTAPSGSRLDIMDVTIKMNMGLPEQITEWPSYISSKSDDMHPETINVKMSNQTDEMNFSGVWTLKGQADQKGKVLDEDGMVFNTYINGWKVDDTYDSAEEGKTGDGGDSGELWSWAISPDIKITKDGEADKFIRIYNEAYGINNDGKILNINDFISGSENPFAVLKQVAAEQIVFVRNLNDNTSFLNRGNLDLVYTPDLAITVVQKLATQAGELMNNSSSEK